MTQAKKRVSTVSKPEVSSAHVRDFVANGRQAGVPEGKVRLSVNIRADLHRKLKDLAYEHDTDIGKMIEGWAAQLPESTLRKRA